MGLSGPTHLRAIAPPPLSRETWLAPAGHRRGSIQGKLLFGFAIITSFTFLATSVAFLASKSLANKLYQIESNSLPPLLDLLAISRQASALAAVSASIARANSGAELETGMGDAAEFRTAMIANLAAIAGPHEGGAELKLLSSLIEDLSFGASCSGMPPLRALAGGQKDCRYPPKQ